MIALHKLNVMHIQKCYKSALDNGISNNYILQLHRIQINKKKLRMASAYKDLDLINCNKSGGVLFKNVFREKFYKEIKNTAVKKIKIHDLRHTHATILLKQGVSPKIISERLDHTDISLTLRIYFHVLPNMREEAVKNPGKSCFS